MDDPLTQALNRIEQLEQEVERMRNAKRADFQVLVDLYRQHPRWYQVLKLCVGLSYKGGYTAGLAARPWRAFFRTSARAGG